MTLKCPYFIKNYVATTLVGSGSYGSVYKAKNLETSTPFAMKIIKKSNLFHNRDLSHLQREIDALAFLRHNSIVALYDFFSNEQFFFLILDWCSGPSLAHYIHHHGPIRETIAATIFQQIVEGVGYCHSRGVAHRDLKPQNILITQFPLVKISDFGLCGFVQPDQDNPLMSTFCGTTCYAPPEVIKGIEYDGCKADIWSLGVILFELVSGKLPWQTQNQVQMQRQINLAQFSIPSDVSPACADLIQSLLHTKPSLRPNCTEILNNSWFRLVGSNRRVQVSLKETSSESKLPSLNLLNMAQFTQSMDRNTFGKDCGIVSPFENIKKHPSMKKDQSDDFLVHKSRMLYRRTRKIFLRQSQICSHH